VERVRTTELAAHVEREVRLLGWLHALRRMGGINFLILRDGWGLVQTVVEDEAALAPLRATDPDAESVIAVEGLAVAAPQAPGGVEVRGPRIAVTAPVTESPPVTVNKRELRAGLTTLLDHAVIAYRHPRQRAVLRLAAGVMAGFRAALTARGFTEVQTPKIVATATEGGTNVFRLDYFGRPADPHPQPLSRKRERGARRVG
jgi:nondiscriminating aspartyl-tRNA synthetase